ncbi:magnesium chelatase subunit D [Natronocella acetinitrilica]|uniref:Magnesium chelatase subunit D n=1 Tax=Natronocella acetinitrilica TaxID=414046 RepID=A0AAE3G5N7_9GAMM|nr:magnesium chelatase subunit D [Natronocella acetinitrilica]MCP1675842.1 magnesium chelatase subunit D [Natronocella acetinitrilica]
MTADARSGLDPEITWQDSLMAAALFAVNPAATGGIALRVSPGPVRDRWLQSLHAYLGDAMTPRKIPINVPDNRLLGGLDLALTLQHGRPILERGVLADSNGGVVLLPMGERLSLSTAGKIAAVMDVGEVRLQRDGLDRISPARFGVVLLDEGIGDEERPPRILLDRLAFRLDLSALLRVPDEQHLIDVDAVGPARTRLAEVQLPEEATEAIAAASVALGVQSLRAVVLSCQVARQAAALVGNTVVGEEEAALAVRLVLGPRATQLPAPPEESEEQEPAEQSAEQSNDQPGDRDHESSERNTKQQDPSGDERVVEASKAMLPEGLLQQLRAQAALTGVRRRAAGQGGYQRKAGARGRPVGTRRGNPGDGARLNVIETLRAAAPWQAVRRASLEKDQAGHIHRILVRPDDFRITRFRPRTETTTVFAVDASGSSAMHRLSEAKGAVELLLAECYVRRDRVALIAFRGAKADVLLPPTRSLVRAKRSLAALPGGGGTPLASGMDAARLVGEEVDRRGGTPVLVLLTDGRANVTREGIGGREQAATDALDAASRIRAAGLRTLVVDTSPQPRALARELAATMGAAYLALPQANAGAISDAVRVATTRMSSPPG